MALVDALLEEDGEVVDDRVATYRGLSQLGFCFLDTTVSGVQVDLMLWYGLSLVLVGCIRLTCV